MHKKVLTAAALAAVCAAGSSTSAMAAGYTSPDGNTTLGAKIYSDFTSKTVKQDGQKVNPSGLGFDVKRFYLNMNHDFGPMWSVRLRTDARYTDAPNGSGQPNVSVYVKQAYIQAKFSNAFKLSLGENDMPWIPFEEHMYGFRYVENTLIDRTHFGNSADFGLHAGGKTRNGMVDYNVAIVNGSGYHSDKRSRSVDFAGRIDAQFVPGLHTALGFYNGKRGENVYSAPGVQVPTQNTTRWDALVAWIQPKYRVGASYFSAKDWRQITSPNVTDKADGYSAWASYLVAPKWTVFGRYDNVKPSKDLQPNLKDKYYNAGIQYEPISNVQVAFVWKHEKVDGGYVGDFYGQPAGSTGKSDEIGIWTQVAF